MSEESREYRELVAEVAELRARVAEHAQAIAERKSIEAALAANEGRYRCLFEEAPISLWEEDFSGLSACFEELRGRGVTDLRAYFAAHPEEVVRCAGMIKVLRVNQATVALVEAASEEEVLQNLLTCFGAETLEVFREEAITLFAGGTRYASETVLYTVKGRRLVVNFGLAVAGGAERTLERVFISLQDITEQRRAEEALRQSLVQEAESRAQVEALTRLAAPLIPISEEVVVMPLIGAFDGRRAQQLMETLLRGVAERRARVAILDITGMTEVDAQVADALLRAAQAVRLLGAQVVLTGIRPEVAPILITLGTDLGSIVTQGTLQSGIAYAMSARGARQPKPA